MVVKAKIIFLLLSASCCLTDLFSQSNWQWAKNAATSPGTDGCGSVSADDSGNVYVTGYFNSATLSFGSTTLTNANSSGSSSDIFLAKYDGNGILLWAKRFGGTNDDDGWSVFVDQTGNVFLAGEFGSSSVIFGIDTLVNVGPGYRHDMFLVKFDVTGNTIWAKSYGGTDYDEAYSITEDTGGNLYVCGGFRSSDFILGNDTLVCHGNAWQDAFIAKFDANGNAVWAKGMGGYDSDFGFSVSADLFGNVFFTGQFGSNTISFGSTTLIGSGIFLAKYDATGNVLWAKRAGAFVSYSVSADPSGNAYITGAFNDSVVTFGPFTLTNNPNYASGMFLTKYDVNGNVLWAKGGKGTGYSVDAKDPENVYVSGSSYNDTLLFGSYSIILPASLEYYPFVANYDENGNLLCASGLASGWSGNNGQTYLSTGGPGGVYVGGEFLNSFFAVGTDTLMAMGGGINLYVAKYNCIDAVGITGPGNDENSFVYPNPSNGIFTLNSAISDGEIFIYNTLGEIVYHGMISTSIRDIDFSGQPNGIYFVNVINERESFTEKIIVQ